MSVLAAAFSPAGEPRRDGWSGSEHKRGSWWFQLRYWLISLLAGHKTLVILNAYIRISPRVSGPPVQVNVPKHCASIVCYNRFGVPGECTLHIAVEERS